MKKFIKKQNIKDTLTNVGLGGVANVAADMVVASVDFLAKQEDTVINAGKIALGALAGSFTGNKYLRAIADGLATVGAANLIKGYIAPAAKQEGAAGLRPGTIGRVRRMTPGNRAFSRRVSGVNSVMGI